MDPRLRGRNPLVNGGLPSQLQVFAVEPSRFPSVESGSAHAAALETAKKDSPLAIQKVFCIVCASNNVNED